MKNAGPNNIKGIEAQLWAALSLFLQHLKKSDFSHIHLEPPKYHDFNIVFIDDRKIICEVKDWETAINYSHLRAILDNIISKHSVCDDDGILIICKRVNQVLLSDIKYVNYFPSLYNKYKNKKYSDNIIQLLPKVKFWLVTKAMNKQIASFLFNDLIDYWLPPETIDDIITNVFVNMIFEGSAKSRTFTRDDIFNEIEERKKISIRESGDFDERRRKRDRQFKDIKANIDDPKSPKWSNSRLKALSSQYDLLAYTFELLKEKTIDKLIDWAPLWNLNKLPFFTARIFDIFRNNLHTNSNITYVYEYIKRNIKYVRGYYRYDLFIAGSIRIIDDILSKEPSKMNLENTLNIISNLIELNNQEYFYIKDYKNDQKVWEKEQICKLLLKTYDLGNKQLKNNVIKLIFSFFNLIDDSGSHFHHSPSQVYTITRKWLSENFKDRFNIIIKKLSNQYDNIYRKYGKKPTFGGWDISGHSSFWGNAYRVSDLNLVNIILKTAIKQFYDKNEKSGWDFIKRRCISPQNKVGPTRPDFLNRAACDIVLSRYSSDDNKISNEAFNILKEFILSRKGIPHKSELIYQSLMDHEITDEKKWQLIRLSTTVYKIPVNPFVEQLVTNLAQKGHMDAKQMLLNWINNPKYYSSQLIVRNTTQNIEALLDVDFEHALSMFNAFINNKYFIEKYDEFEVYDVAYLFHKIIQHNFDSGLAILNEFSKKKSLTRNQQILLCYGLTGQISNEKENDSAISKLIFDKFVNPLLNKHARKTSKLHKWIKHGNAREAFLHLADKLAKSGFYEESLRIVEYFLDDPNPYMPGKNPEEPKGEFNEQKRIIDGEAPSTIRSIRGRCAWTLMNCAVPKGRNYLDKVVKLTDKLLIDKNGRIKEKNWYVIHMATFTIAQLAKNRLAVNPKNKSEMFFSKSRKKTLIMAKHVENIAFKLLDAVSKSNKSIQNAMVQSVLQPFDHIRALNNSDAKSLLKFLENISTQALGSTLALLIYYAEFRKGQYKKCTWNMKGYYDDLEPFDDSGFKQYLNKLISSDSESIRTDLSWHFWTLPRNSKNKKQFKKMFNVSTRYLNKLANRYNHDVYYRIYAFIKDFIDNNFDQCFKLWAKCLKKEKEYFIHNADKVNEMYFWPNCWNGEILVKIKNKKGYGNKEFLKWFSHLSDYPAGFNIGNAESAIKELDVFPESNKEVKIIIDNLININRRSDINLANMASARL